MVTMQLLRIVVGVLYPLGRERNGLRDAVLVDDHAVAGHRGAVSRALPAPDDTQHSAHCRVTIHTTRATRTGRTHISAGGRKETSITQVSDRTHHKHT